MLVGDKQGTTVKEKRTIWRRHEDGVSYTLGKRGVLLKNIHKRNVGKAKGAAYKDDTLTPEMVCSWESRVSTRARLRSMGILQGLSADKLQEPINLLEDRLRQRKLILSQHEMRLSKMKVESDSSDSSESQAFHQHRSKLFENAIIGPLRVHVKQYEDIIKCAKYIRRVMQHVSWETTANYVHEKVRNLGIGGGCDPSGCGEGFDFVKLSGPSAEETTEETVKSISRRQRRALRERGTPSTPVEDRDPVAADEPFDIFTDDIVDQSAREDIASRAEKRDKELQKLVRLISHFEGLQKANPGVKKKVRVLRRRIYTYDNDGKATVRVIYMKQGEISKKSVSRKKALVNVRIHSGVKGADVFPLPYSKGKLERQKSIFAPRGVAKSRKNILKLPSFSGSSKRNPAQSESSPAKRNPKRARPSSPVAADAYVKTYAKSGGSARKGRGVKYSLNKIFASILDDTKKLKKFQPFVEPVVKVYPALKASYEKIISQPMDLSTMSKHASYSMYQSQDEFLSDAELICSNCLTFNPSNTALCVLAREMASKVRNLLQSKSGQIDEILRSEARQTRADSKGTPVAKKAAPETVPKDADVDDMTDVSLYDGGLGSVQDVPDGSTYAHEEVLLEYMQRQRLDEDDLEGLDEDEDADMGY